MKFIFGKQQTDKHKSFRRVDTIIFGVRSQAYPRYPK